MKNKIIRITLYVALAIITYFTSINYISKKTNVALQQIKDQTIFINQKAENKLETGSMNYPYHSINTALEERKNHPYEEKWTLIISTGNYNENIRIPENTTLFGNKKNNEIVNITALDKESDTLVLSEKVNLINLNINEGLNGILIPFNTNSNIINTTISNAGKFNLKMGSDGDYNDDEVIEEVILNKTKEEIEEIPLVKISNSIIKNATNQGLYLENGRVEIKNSKIINNKEEGIDLHPHMYVKILNNEISNNGESGVESEIKDNILFIENNKIENNLRSGIALLTAVGTGNVNINDNSITSNAKFGIRCARHKNPPKKYRPFFSSVIKQENNVIRNNTEGAFSLDCINF